MMIATMKQNWWLPVVRGVFAILFGAIALFMPGLALTALVVVFGIYALLDGAIAVYNAFQNRKRYEHWWINLIEGVIGVIAGIIALIMPVLAGITLLLVMGFWAIATGVMQVYLAFRLRKEIDNEVYLGIAGILSILFGLFVILFPLGGALAIAWLIGIYSILFGAFMIALGLRLRNLETSTDNTATTMTSHPSVS